MSVVNAVDEQALKRLIAEEEDRFRELHPESARVTQQAEHALAAGVASGGQLTNPHPIYIREASGSKIVDVDGLEYSDFHGGYGAMAVGHAHPKIVAAVNDRVARGTHFGLPTEESAEVAEHLRERMNQPLWRFGNSGTEVTMTALRIMRAYTGRDIVIKVEGSYHGHHDAVMVSVTPDEDAIGNVYKPASAAQSLGLPQSYLDLTKVVPFNDLEALERRLEEHKGEVAGMIIEPAMMNVGIIMPDTGYLAEVKDLLASHGALLCVDEVKTGVSIHYSGASQRFGVQPDLIAMAKSYGGGLPCGALGGSEEVMGWMARNVPQQGTFSGNPLSMAAARATLTEVLVPEAYEKFEAQAEILRDACDTALKSAGIPGYTTALAARGAVTYSDEPLRNYRDVLKVPDQLAYAQWLVQINRGVFMAPWGKLENWTLSVAHDDEDIQRWNANFQHFCDALAS
jgi:glutamate-1-semialdehyde 2,1-aminomutase